MAMKIDGFSWKIGEKICFNVLIMNYDVMIMQIYQILG